MIRTVLFSRFKTHTLSSFTRRWRSGGERSEIAFFDLETTVPTKSGKPFAILEFGAILVCPRTIVERYSYSTLVRPTDLSLISTLSKRRSGITRDGVLSAPTFAEIADKVYDILDGRIWAGHNIKRFDCARIREAFAEIGQSPPEPKAIIDTLSLLSPTFGERAGDMKMASLAKCFGLGDQTHRSLDDVRMNLKVLKSYATAVLLESILGSNVLGTLQTDEAKTGRQQDEPVPSPDPDDAKEESFWGVDQVSASSISASLRMKLLHKDAPLHLCCDSLKVRFRKYMDHDGRPRLNIVVDVPPDVCKILDNVAHNLSIHSGTSSDWRPTVMRKESFANYPTAILQISSESNGDDVRCGTQVYQKEEPLETIQKLDDFKKYSG